MNKPYVDIKNAYSAQLWQAVILFDGDLIKSWCVKWQRALGASMSFQ